MNGILGAALKSPHTTYPAIGFAALTAVDHIAQVWFPAHAAQIEATTKDLKGLCILWLGVAAPQFSNVPSKDDLNKLAQNTASSIRTGDTTLLDKKP